MIQITSVGDSVCGSVVPVDNQDPIDHYRVQVYSKSELQITTTTWPVQSDQITRRFELVPPHGDQITQQKYPAWKPIGLK